MISQQFFITQHRDNVGGEEGKGKRQQNIERAQLECQMQSHHLVLISHVCHHSTLCDDYEEKNFALKLPVSIS